MTAPRIRVGTAGWSINSSLACRFAPTGSALTRYASVFDCVEINSSFYRPHRKETYARWATSVPEDFRFSVKLPKAVSHEAKLALEDGALDRFAEEAGTLGDKLGAVLVQLAPSHVFSPDLAEPFFVRCSKAWTARTVLEPRHHSWFEGEAPALLGKYDIALVGADPARPAHASEPVSANGLAYWRLHGAPKIYYSNYEDAAIAGYVERMKASAATERWCIFDNTAAGAALGNALTMRAMLEGKTVS